MSVCQTPIIVALDYPTRDAALKLADQLDPKLCRVKVGKELFTSCAAEIVGTLRDKGFEVFLDLKFHDIPNTTAMAVKAAAEMGVWMVNVHCSGGLRMMSACREVLEQRSGPKPLLIGVTVLTSMEREDLAGIGLDIEPQEQVPRPAGIGHRRDAFGRGGVHMVDHGQRRAGAPYVAPGFAQAAEGLGAGVFVDHLAVYIKQDMALVIQGAHRVGIDVFVVKGSGSHFS